MKTQEEIEQLAEQYINKYTGDHYVYCAYVDAYTQCQEDVANKNTWTFEEILDACYPTLGRGGDWVQIAIRLKEQKNKQD